MLQNEKLVSSAGSSSLPILHDATLSVMSALRASMSRAGHRDVTFLLEAPREEVVRARLPALSVYLHYLEKCDDEGPGDVRLHYLISAWAATTNEELVLFSDALRGLLLQRTIMGEGLQGESFDADTVLPVVLSNRLTERDLVQIWSSLGHPPRPTLQCWTSLSALRPDDCEEPKAPIVLDRELRFARRLR